MPRHRIDACDVDLSCTHSIANNILRPIRYSGLNNTGQACNSRGTVNVNRSPSRVGITKGARGISRGYHPIVDRPDHERDKDEMQTMWSKEKEREREREREAKRQGVILNDPPTNLFFFSNVDNAMGTLGTRSCRKLKTTSFNAIIEKFDYESDKECINPE